MDKRIRSANRKWSKELILNEILNLKEVSAKQNQLQHSGLYGAAIRYFGSWKNAVEAAGLNYTHVRKNKKSGYWTEAIIIESILTLPKKHSSFVRRNHADLYNGALRFFGSWEKAVSSAGLDYGKIQKEWSPKKKRNRA